jgi:hypothetical protein
MSETEDADNGDTFFESILNNINNVSNQQQW